MSDLKPMRATNSLIPGVKRLSLQVHTDQRGHFVESYQTAVYKKCLGDDFVPRQHNVSSSSQAVLRGLHYQRLSPQAKLVRVLKGKIWDVVVDLRLRSPTYGQHVAYTLYGPEYAPKHAHEQLWIPAGLAHGFYVYSDEAIVEYSCNAVYRCGDEYSLQWNDPRLAINWPDPSPILSPKDQNAHSLYALEQAGLLPVVTVA